MTGKISKSWATSEAVVTTMYTGLLNGMLFIFTLAVHFTLMILLAAKIRRILTVSATEMLLSGKQPKIQLIMHLHPVPKLLMP